MANLTDQELDVLEAQAKGQIYPGPDGMLIHHPVGMIMSDVILSLVEEVRAYRRFLNGLESSGQYYERKRKEAGSS